MDELPHFSADEVAVARRYAMMRPAAPVDPAIGDLVKDLIACVADRWTMQILDVLTEHGEQRFSRLARHVPGISQKMLTQSLRRMERDGLVASNRVRGGAAAGRIPPDQPWRRPRVGLLRGLGLGGREPACGDRRAAGP